MAPRPYKRGDPSSLPGNEPLRLERELKSIERSISSILPVLPDTTTKTKAELLALTGVLQWQIAFISNPASNKHMVFFDGTSWRYPDGVVVS